MSSNRPVVGTHEAWMPIRKSRRRHDAAPADSPATRAESMQKNGKRMVIAGFVISVVGVVLYCAVTFTGGIDAYTGDILFRNGVSLGKVTLAVLALGTLVWLVGSFTYLQGAMDADEESGEDENPDAK